jgi:hypothetical protein
MKAKEPDHRLPDPCILFKRPAGRVFPYKSAGTDRTDETTEKQGRASEILQRQ